jgi:copper(I)-binding protein
LPFRTTSILAVAALALPLVLPIHALSHDFKVGSLELMHPWSAKAPAVAPVLGAYLTIVNTGMQSDRLVGGTTTVAERLEIHKSTIVDGIARMRPAKEGIEIPAGATLNLQPGGAHIMLVNPKQRLAEGEKFKATLEFEKAGSVEVQFVVQKPKPSSGENHSGHKSP